MRVVVALPFFANVPRLENVPVDPPMMLSLFALKVDPLSFTLTCDVRNIPLDEALRQVLWSKGFYTAIEVDALVITTCDGIMKRTVTSLYPLAGVPRPQIPARGEP